MTKEIGHLSLGSILSRMLQSMRSTFVTDETSGQVSEMVYVPPFTVPTGALPGPWPSEDLDMGGFLIDKYPCSHQDATPSVMGCDPDLVVTAGDGNVATSRLGVQTWRRISKDSAVVACYNRQIFGGQACHLVNAYEYASLIVLAKLIGAEVAGNVVGSSADWGDGGCIKGLFSDEAWLAGTGQGGTSLFSTPDGPFDVVGNVWEWMNMDIDYGVYGHAKQALIDDADGITAVDTEITIDRVQESENWPAGNSLAFIQGEGGNTDEWVWYDEMTYNDVQGNWTLSGCLRGQKGTAASAHSNNATVFQTTHHCLVPEGYRHYVSSGLDNTTDPVTFAYTEDLGDAPAVGHILKCEDELLEVTNVVGSDVTVTRGYGGSTPASHADDTAFVRIRTDCTYGITTDGGLVVTQKGAIDELLSIANMSWSKYAALPATMRAPGADPDYDDYLYITWGEGDDDMALCRGGGHADSSPAVSGFATMMCANVGAPDIGFRAAFDLAHSSIKPFGS